MNYDAAKLAEIHEARRSNRRKEEIEAIKAEAAARTSRAKVADTAIKASTGLAGLLGRNDPAWEAPIKDPALMKPGLLSYVTRDSGTHVILEDSFYTAEITKSQFSVMKMVYEPTLGNVDGDQGNAWLTFKVMYDEWRGKNRGATNYTVNDVIHFFFPVLTIVAQVAAIERALKLVRMYSYSEAIVPKQLLGTLNIDAQSVQENWTDLVDHLAFLKAKLNLIPMPKDLSVLKRWIWLNSYVFADTLDFVRQFYVPCAASYHTTNTSGPYYLTATQKVNSALIPAAANIIGASGIHTWINTFSAEIDRILQNTTFQAISGDIYNYYGTDQLAVFNKETDYNDSPIIYDEEFNVQMANAAMHKFSLDPSIDQFGLKLSTKGQIGQGVFAWNGTDSSIEPIWICFATASDGLWSNGTLVRPIYKDELDDKETFIATAFQIQVNKHVSGDVSYSYYDYSDDTWKTGTIIYQGTDHAQVNTYRTELIVDWFMVKFDPTNPSASAPTDVNRLENNAVPAIGTFVAMLGYDVLPALYFTLGTGRYPCFDCDSYGVYTREAFINLTRSSLFALWGIPVDRRGSYSSPDGGKRDQGRSRGNKHGDTRPPEQKMKEDKK